MNIVIFGPQGSGKRVQAKKIAEKYNLEHIETGHIFREIAKKNTPLGKKINACINERKEMAPDYDTIEVLKHYLDKISPEKGVILDSAPRTIGQIEPVEEMLEERGRSLDKALYIKLSSEESVARISKRYICSLCHNNFVLGKDIKSDQEPCPLCGSKIMQREDDTPEGVTKRLKVFYETTTPVIDHYREAGRLLEIDGNQEIEKVFEDITQALKAE
jgi:adenylate kinase